MSSHPLIVHTSPRAVVAWRDGRAITAAQYLADVARLARLLPDRAHVLNVCADRYRFAVGLGAALLRAQASLLPPTPTPEVVRRLREFSADIYCLADEPRADIDLPRLDYPEGEAAKMPGEFAVPRIDGGQLCAIVFTSGSTGVPQPHPKRWGPLVRDVRGEAERLGLLPGAGHAIVATVPPQHMYGFESSLLIALQSGASFAAGRPFYPADIAAAVDAIDARRTLVTTPFHLRALLAEDLPLPALELLVCATAPLSVQLARQAEERARAPLLEIYGCTETGQLASRRTARDTEWETLPGVVLEMRDGQAWASGGHIERAMPVGDILELRSPSRFLLHGRAADMVNIAGKRTSLGYLNHQLNAIPGVADGAFFLPDGRDDAPEDPVARLMAFVVAPGLSRAAVLEGLRRRVDAVFLPRPLVFVDALQRAATGKLPIETLRELAAAHASGVSPHAALPPEGAASALGRPGGGGTP